MRITFTLKSILLLAGSFVFAFLFGETVHEYGHYLAHMVYGNSGVQIYLDPYGGSRIVSTDLTLSDEVWGMTSAAGPLLNLTMGMLCFLLLWRFRQPVFLPLLLWGPVAMVQEGVTFSVGLLTSGGDARWVANLGIPPVLLLLAGVGLLLGGLRLVAALLSLAGIKTGDSFGGKFFIVLPGMGSLMLVRFMHSVIVSPQYINENFVPLVFTLLLSVTVVLMHNSNARIADEISSASPMVTWFVPVVALIFGSGIFLFQVFALN